MRELTINETCSDGMMLGQDSTQYNCRKCGNSLNAHTKDCALQTPVTENNLVLSESDTLLNEANSQVASLEAQIGASENENAVLLKKIGTASRGCGGLPATIQCRETLTRKSYMVPRHRAG